MSNADDFKDWQQSQADIAQRDIERRFFAYINSMSDELKAVINNIDELESLSHYQIEQLIGELVAIQDKFYGDARSELIDLLIYLSGYIAVTESKGLEIDEPQPEQVNKSLLSLPIAASGMLLLMHINNYISYANKKLDNTVRFAWANKMTAKELKARVIGTALKAYRDGVMGDSKMKARAMIDAAIQHSINTATIETWKRNDIKYYILRAEIDNRTTEYCRSINNLVQEVGSGLMPPFHYRCRTKMINIADDGFVMSRKATINLADYLPTSKNITYNTYKKDNPRA